VAVPPGDPPPEVVLHLREKWKAGENATLLRMLSK